MPAWQRNLFSFLVRNVGFLVNFMGIPPERLIVYLAYIDIDRRQMDTAANAG
jgi:hypothetical protein